MEKSGPIELQIASGLTPMPFMVPFNKAKDRQALEALIRRRCKCGDDVKITMYMRGMKIIDWEDWDELVEPGQWYLADINDSWIVHSRGLGNGTGLSSLNMFLGGVEQGNGNVNIKAARARNSVAAVPAENSNAKSVVSEGTAAKPVARVDNSAAKPVSPPATAVEIPAASVVAAAKNPAALIEHPKNLSVPAGRSQSVQQQNPVDPGTMFVRAGARVQPDPAGMPGMSHGIVRVNLAEERNIMEDLQKQIGSLVAAEQSATSQKSSGKQSKASFSATASTSGSEGPRGERQDEIHGGVKLENSGSNIPPSIAKLATKTLAGTESEKIGTDAKMLNERSPAAVKPNAAKSIPRQPASAKEATPKIPTADLAPSENQNRQPAAVKKTPSQTSSHKSSSYQAAASNLTAPPKPVSIKSGSGRTFSARAALTQPKAAKPAERPVYKIRQQLKSDSGEESSPEGSQVESPVRSTPEIVQGQDGGSADTSGDEEEGEETYETVETSGSSSSRSGAMTKDKSLPVDSTGISDDLTADESKIIFFLVKPKDKNKPIDLDDNSLRIFVSISIESCPSRLIDMLGKNPCYTRLLVLWPDADMSRYVTMDVINPGSRLAGTPFTVIGWSTHNAITITWEHIENNEEPERINLGNIWDQPDPETVKA